jgi:hypothetical protein
LKNPLSAGRDARLRIDLALPKALDQRLGREVHEDDLVGLGQLAVGHGLPDADAGELEHRVVEALQVLHVDRREDVDVGGQDLRDVLVALGVLDAGRVRVRELVDEDQLGHTRQNRREVHLLERRAPVLDPAAGDDLEALDQPPGARAPVGLDDPHGHVAAGVRLGVALLEHPVRLADARGHPEEDLVAARHGHTLRQSPRQDGSAMKR